MSEFIRQLAKQRQKFLDGLDANKGDINLDIFEDFYPDQAHFIYELLQNAEDVRATRATFILNSDGCSFEHDGKHLFTEDNVRRITGIHNSSKTNSPDQIGQFGIGFKSVFVYTQTPMVRSGEFAFKITGLVMPECIDDAPNNGNQTRFEIPFNSSKKTVQDAYDEIKAGLNAMTETTLLFLTHLKSVCWQVGDSISGEVERLSYSENHFEVRKKIDGETTASSHFLRFDEPVEGLEEKRVAVAFALDLLTKVEPFNPKDSLTKQMKIVPANPGRVAVFFPAEKETSGLRFHLHAPFVPELSRASIKDTQANNPLFQQLANLTAASLHTIRDLGLLSADFLGVLPNSKDTIPPRYNEIRSAIVEEMNNQPLTPTHADSHAPAKHLLQAKDSLKKLLSESDIESLVDYEEKPPRWAVGAPQKNSPVDRFLDGLAITKWDIEKFVEMLCNKTSTSNYHSGPPAKVTPEEVMTWLGNKSSEWHQRLYALLSSENPSTLDRAKSLRIIRLSDGSYSVGPKCFFPSEGVEHDAEMPRVSNAVYSSGTNEEQKNAARKFLEDVGVRDVGEAEQVEAILKRRYRSEGFKPDKQDLKRFIALVEMEPKKATLFAKYLIFEGKDGKWRLPSQVFLDAPFLDTGLSAYFEALGDGLQKIALSDSYQDGSISVESLQKFARAVGVQESLCVTKLLCDTNPCWKELSSGDNLKATNDSYKRFDHDFDVFEFSKLTACPTVAASRLIWLTMMKYVRPEHLVAKYQRNNLSEARTNDSRLVHRIRSAAWVPQCDGRFVTPAQAEQSLLPSGFPFDSGERWIKAIGFGAETQQKADEQRRIQDLANESGFSDNETYERAKQFAALPQEEQVRILEYWQRKSSVELPEHEPVNPARRAELVGEKAACDPERLTEKRIRTVPVGLDEVSQDAGQYLREQYTNGSGQMICQVCKTELPFKLNDGTYYFDKKEFLSELPLRHRENYLAMCPNHWAMFQHANGTRDEMKAMFEAMEDEHLELEVVLGQQDHTIYFTKTHRQDLLTVIAASRDVTRTASDS